MQVMVRITLRNAIQMPSQCLDTIRFESNLSLTGASADYRTPVKASEMGGL